MPFLSTTSREDKLHCAKKFSGTVGVKPGEKIDIELLAGGRVSGPGGAEEGQASVILPAA